MFRAVVMLLALGWSGYFIYRLASAIPTALARGRYDLVYPKRMRRVSAHGTPVEYGLTLLLWSLMLVFFLVVFAGAGYSLIRSLIAAIAGP